jgi:hypothetical protein
MIKKFNAPDTEPYDRYQMKLHERAIALVSEWADVVGFAHRRSSPSPRTPAQKKVTRGTGGQRRLLSVEERPAYDAKNRYSLPADLEFPKVGAWESSPTRARRRSRRSTSFPSSPASRKATPIAAWARRSKRSSAMSSARFAKRFARMKCAVCHVQIPDDDESPQQRGHARCPERVRPRDGQACERRNDDGRRSRRAIVEALCP